MVASAVAGLHRLAKLFAHQRLGHGRHVRQRAQRGVGLVLADDAVGLAAAVLALDRHRRAEIDLGGVAWRLDYLGGRPARGPIAQIPVDLGNQRRSSASWAAACSTMQPRELGLDQLETLGGDEIMRGNRPVGQVVIDLPAFGSLVKALLMRALYHASPLIVICGAGAGSVGNCALK